MENLIEILILIIIPILVGALAVIGVPIQQTADGRQSGYVLFMDDDVFKGGDTQVAVRGGIEASDVYECYVHKENKELLIELCNAMHNKDRVIFYYKQTILGGLLRPGCYIQYIEKTEE